MKKNILVQILILVVCVNSFAQITIKTPTNKSIEAYNLIEYSSAILAIIEEDAEEWIDDHDSDAVRIGAATRTYNCHAYAWHKSDGGSTCWINLLDDNENANLSKYWSGVSPTYSSTSSTYATKLLYTQEDDDHSVIATSTPGTYRSKWGAWPLYNHSLGNSPYSTTGMEFYKLDVSGDDLVCNPATKTYSTLNIPNSTYSWCPSKFTISDSSYSVSATTSSTGSGYIQVSISSAYSGTTITGKLPVWVGVPSIPTTNPTGTNPYDEIEVGTYKYVSLVSTPGAAPSSGSWSAGYHLSTTGSTSGSWHSFYGSSEGMGAFYVSTSNSCGTSTVKQGGISVIDDGGGDPPPPVPLFEDETSDPIMKIGPNPASNYLNITFDKLNNTATGGYRILIYDTSSKVVITDTMDGLNKRLYVGDLNEGLYIMHLIVDGKVFQEKFIVTK